MNKKILVLLISCILVGMYTPMVIGNEVSVSGTFTPNTTIAITTNNTSLVFGSVDLNTNTTGYVNVSNIGDTIASVVVQASGPDTNWTLEAWDSSVPTQDHYFLGGEGVAGEGGQEFAFTDLSVEATVDANFPASGTAGNYSNVEIDLLLSATTTLDATEEGFWVNFTASAAT